MPVVEVCRAGPDGLPCGNARTGDKTPDQCSLCWINQYTRDELLAMAPPRRINPLDCRHRLPPTGRTVQCESCRGAVMLKVFGCDLHGECTLARQVPVVQCCATCPDKEAP